MIVFLLLLLGAVMNDTSARDVISFNTGWQFKKGPFSTDPMRASAQWDGCLPSPCKHKTFLSVKRK